jgi:spore germination protein GerM
VRSVLALAALAGLAVACGVPSDASPRALAAHEVPFGLLGPTSTSTSEPPDLSGYPRASVVIYLVKQGRLVAASRQVRAPVSLAKTLTALLVGPTDAEAAQDIQTAIGPSATLLSANVTAGVATLNMSSGFGQVAGPSQITEVAQLVFTATTEPPVGAVTFELQGQPVQVPDGEGTLTGRPLTRRDFPALAPL